MTSRLLTAAALVLALAAPLPAVAQTSMTAYDAARQALLAVWAELPLTVRNATITAERATRYGGYTPRDSNEFAPGDKINVYVEVFGYGWRDNGDGTFSELLEADLNLIDASGATIAAQQKFLSADIRGREKLLETYLTLDATLSDFEPGDYRLRYVLRDVAGGKETSFELPVTLIAGEPPAAPQ